MALHTWIEFLGFFGLIEFVESLVCEENFGCEVLGSSCYFKTLDHFSSLYKFYKMYIPDDKRYFRIGEVSRIVGVKPYVLRYWESEFPTVRPKRADSRQRVYKREDIETLGAIKKLLYEEKLTIAGAKNRLKAMKKGDATAVPQGDILAEIKEELHQILRMLQ